MNMLMLEDQGIGSDSSAKRVLVLDDNDQTLRVLVRTFQKHFDEVLAASTPAEAEVFLLTHEVTHLVCDYDLGDNWPKGTDLIQKYRTLQKSIRRAVLLTGRRAYEIQAPPEVDAIITKSDGTEALIAALNP